MSDEPSRATPPPPSQGDEQQQQQQHTEEAPPPTIAPFIVPAPPPMPDSPATPQVAIADAHNTTAAEATKPKPVSQMTPEEIAAEARRILLSSPRGMRSNAYTESLNTTLNNTTSGGLFGLRRGGGSGPHAAQQDGTAANDDDDAEGVYDYSNYTADADGGFRSPQKQQQQQAAKSAMKMRSDSNSGYNSTSSAAAGADAAPPPPRDTFGDDSRIETNYQRNSNRYHSDSAEDSAASASGMRSSRRVTITEERQFADEVVETVELPPALALLYQAAYAVQVKTPCENLKKLLLDIAVVNTARRAAEEAAAERLRRDACLRLYAQSTDRLSRREELRESVKKQLLESDDKECTFRPTISQHGQQLRRAYHTSGGRVDFVAMNESSKEWLRNREKKLKAKADKAERDEADAIKEAKVPMSEKSKRLAERYRAKQEEKAALEAALSDLQASGSIGGMGMGSTSMMHFSSASASPPMGGYVDASGGAGSPNPYRSRHNGDGGNGVLSPIRNADGSMVSAAAAGSPLMIKVRRAKRMIRKKASAAATAADAAEGASEAAANNNNTCSAEAPTREASPATLAPATPPFASADEAKRGGNGNEAEEADDDDDRALASDEEYYYEEVEEEVEAMPDDDGSPNHHHHNGGGYDSMSSYRQASESAARYLDISGNVDTALLEKMQSYRRSVLHDAANKDYYPSFEPVTNGAAAFEHYFSPNRSNAAGRTGTSALIMSPSGGGGGASTPGRDGGGGATADDGQTNANARIVQRLLDDVEQRKIRQAQRIEEAEERRKEKLFDPMTGQPFFQPNAVPTVVIGKKRVPVTELPPKEREEALKILKKQKLDFLLSSAKKKEEAGSPTRDLDTFLKYCNEMQTQAARKMEKIRRLEDKELEGLFVPAVNAKSTRIIQSKNPEAVHKRELPRKEAPPPPPPKRESDGEAIKNMMERSKQWEERRENLKNRKIRQLEKEATEECTFNPKLRKRVATEMTAAAEQRLAGELAMLRSQQELLRIEDEQRGLLATAAAAQRNASRSVGSVRSAHSNANQLVGPAGTNYNTAPLHFITSSGSIRRERNCGGYADPMNPSSMNDGGNNMFQQPQQQQQQEGGGGSGLQTHRSEAEGSAFGNHVLSVGGSFRHDGGYDQQQQQHFTGGYSTAGYPQPPAGSAAHAASVGSTAGGYPQPPNPAAATSPAAEPTVDDLIDSWKELDALTDAILSGSP